MANLENIVYDSFYTYAGMVIADRAIVDVRDCLKPSPRVLLYNQYRSKNFSNKGFVKSAALVGEALKTFYYHSDSSCYQMYCRMAAPYAMRYPLNDFHGNYGALSEGGQPAAMRYTEMRLSELSTKHLFDGLNHNAIDEWRDNFDETDQSPRCLPSIGYYNICNGSIGLGIGVSSSIPQFNLREVNKALIALIQNPNCVDDDIYCAPDFATGGTIMNAKEVRESVLKGQGAACRIRSNITYNAKQHELLISSLPFGVYSETIVDQIKKLLEEDENYGIISIFDNSSDTAEISLGLAKDKEPASMIHKLYHDTSLEDYFSINMIMLDQGRYPKVFGWRAACQAYIDHIRACKRREIQFDLDALIARNHILDGLLMAIAHVDEVVALIRKSHSVNEARAALMSRYNLDELQAKAILDLKLQRLANMEAIKVENEHKENVAKIEQLNNILGDQKEVDKLLIAALEEVAAKFGDARRTKLTDLLGENGEPEEEKDVVLSWDSTTIKVNTRGRKNLIHTTNRGTILLVSNQGKMSRISVQEILNLGSEKISSYLKDKDPIVFCGDLAQIQLGKYWIFITKEGFVKKSDIGEYNYYGRNGTKMLKLHEADTVVACGILQSDDELFSFGKDNGICGSAVKATGKNAIGTKKLTN